MLVYAYEMAIQTYICNYYYILLFGTAMVFDDNKENTYIQYIHTSDLLLAVKIVSANKCLSKS